MYLNSINHFRAISTIIIVFSHCFVLSDFKINSFIEKIYFNLLLGGTIFFVFISGVLFHNVFYPKFEYKKFMLKKIKYILTPYLIIASPLYAYYVFLDESIWHIYIPKGDGIKAQYLIPFLKYYVTGFRILNFWYIPFAMILFGISPIFIRFIKLSTSNQLILITLLLIFGSLIHRPDYNSVWDVLQSIPYFSPVFLLGIISSIHKDLIINKLRGKEFYLFGLGLILAVLAAWLGQVGNLFTSPFELNRFDLMIFQKLIFCFFFFTWLNRFENRKFDTLNTISNNSFGIFFIHPVLIIIFSKLKLILTISFPPNQPLIYIATSLIIFLFSLLITLTVKKLFPNHSRLIVGS